MLAPPNEFIRDNGVATGFVCVADRKDRSKGGRCLLRQRFQNSGVGVPLAAVKLCGSGKAAEQTRRNEEILVAHAAGKTAAALAKQFGLSKSRISLYFR